MKVKNSSSNTNSWCIEKIAKKNIKLWAGKLLINFINHIEKEISKIYSIKVSTKNKKNTAIVRRSLATNPWLRSSELSKDNLKSSDVAIHVVNWSHLNYVDVVRLLLFQLTFCFHDDLTLKSGVKQFKDESFEAVLGVRLLHEQSLWTLRKAKEVLEPFWGNTFLFKPLCEVIKKNYEQSGNFYRMFPTDLISSKSLVNKLAYPLLPIQYIKNINIVPQYDFERMNRL